MPVVMVSLPEPPTKFSMPQRVSLPDCMLETLPRPARPVPRLAVMLAVMADMSSVSTPALPPTSSPQ